MKNQKTYVFAVVVVAMLFAGSLERTEKSQLQRSGAGKLLRPLTVLEADGVSPIPPPPPPKGVSRAV